MKRLLIAGPRSGVGKTTVTLGLLAGLGRRGLIVQPFKVGPDYIDISFHAALTRRPCYNLDGWMMPADRLADTFRRAVAAGARAPAATPRGADIAVVEGMMGLFDGVGSAQSGGSSADVARRLGLPVVLVLDVHAMAGSAGAAALGYREYDTGIDFSGVILNRVAGEHHALVCRKSLERAGIPVLGVVPIDDDLRMPERHLGLVPVWERAGPAAAVEERALAVASHLDLDALLEVADSAVPAELAAPAPAPAPPAPVPAAADRVRIGVARDDAFGFYYQDTLDALAAAGAELVIFRPTADERLPERLAGLYLGGGFPERHLDVLEANTSLRDEIRARAEAGMPIIAECGGLMYLCRSITAGGARRAMVGLLDGQVRMGGRQAVAYVDVEVVRDTPLAPGGSRLRGHVFHNSVIEGIGDGADFAYQLNPGPGIVDLRDGWVRYNVVASYTHLPLAAHPELIHRWLDACRVHRAPGPRRGAPSPG